MQVPIEAQVECVKRELRYRDHVYTRRVLAGKMTRKKADEELEAMKAVLATLNEIAAIERLI